MKHLKKLIILSFILLQISAANLFSQKNKLPEDFLTSKCIVGITCSDELYSNYYSTISKNFNSLGSKIEYYYLLNENPTLRRKKLLACEQDIKGRNIEYKYVINIGYTFNPLDKSLSYLIAVSKTEDKSLLLSDYSFMTLGSSIEDLFKKINKKIPKPKNENLFASPIIKEDTKEYKDYPGNLNNETIIFLEYEQIPIEEKLPGYFKKMYEDRNRTATKSNEILGEKVKKYPFKFIVSRRSEYKDSLKNTCRYVLENDIMEQYNNGVSIYIDKKEVYKSNMFIRDLKTGEKYILFHLDYNHAYDYEYIMEKFIKEVRRKYQLSN